MSEAELPAGGEAEWPGGGGEAGAGTEGGATAANGWGSAGLPFENMGTDVAAADLPVRSRGVIGLLEENCTVCMLCARECPDWCIYIESHKEPVPGSGGCRRHPSGKARTSKIPSRSSTTPGPRS